jgi:hypothetical protein
MIKTIVKVVLGISLLIVFGFYLFDQPEELDEMPLETRGVWEETSDDVLQEFKKPSTVIIDAKSVRLNMYNFDNELTRKNYTPSHITKKSRTITVYCPRESSYTEVYEIIPEKNGGFLWIYENVGGSEYKLGRFVMK